MKAWAKAQPMTALSSAEAELIAATKAGTELVGYKHALEDVGMNTKLKLVVDASAAIGMMTRSGVGTAKHSETRWMWMQGAIRRKDIQLEKVHSHDNPEDLFTKSLCHNVMVRHMNFLGFFYK